MIYSIYRLIKPTVCFAIAFLCCSNVKAQIALIQKSIDKIESHKNFSYQQINRLKEYFTNDTLTRQSQNIIFKAPEDKVLGYLYKKETINKADNSAVTEFYDGRNQLTLNLADSAYQTDEIQVIAVRNLLVDLNWIKEFVAKRPSKLLNATDTAINGNSCSHLIIITRDTVINKEHLYTRLHLFIDKVSDMPVCLLRNARSADIGEGITNYYSKDSYFNYRFDRDDISPANLTIPNGFHEYQQETALALLAPGTVAPDWVLDGMDGSKLSLSQLKGKVVLLDYFFVGCQFCMSSLKPLNNIHEKYKNQKVVIVSLTDRDTKKAVVQFEKIYNIKYPIYIKGSNAVKSYHVSGFPTFYVIDKEGKIADGFVGYNKGFEEKVTAIIDRVLKN